MGISTILKDAVNCRIYRAETKKEMLQLLINSSISLVVLDFVLTDLSSTDDLYNLIARFSGTKWIVFSDDFNAPFIKRLLHSNAEVSFLLKSASLEEVNNCLRSVTRDQNYLSPSLLSMLEEEQEQTKEKLTLTEMEIIKEIANGLSAKQVAQKRNASIHTIITHKKNIYRKLQINTIQEAYIYAMRAGILNINDYAI